MKNPNIYPYNVFRGKYIEPFVFAPITVFYGNNGSGKSTLLNIIANKLELMGKEYVTSNSFGITDYCGSFSSGCSYSLGEMTLAKVLKVKIFCTK
jgi:ABC-type multidrug transport system ATPase subunit